jgi:hypothetical protein
VTERRYPTVSRTEMDRLATALLAAGEVSTANSVAWQQIDDDVPVDEVHQVCDAILLALDGIVRSDDPVDSDVVEGRFAASLHQALRGLPVQVLDDPGFWRYLSLHLWDFVAWRENLTETNVRVYVDGTRNSECVPLRMFLRAQAVVDGDDYSLCSDIPEATDFWRSHIVRVRTGTHPPLARAFARSHRDHRMPTDPVLRPFARRLNRLTSNLVLPLVDDTECDGIVSELRAAQAAGE